MRSFNHIDIYDASPSNVESASQSSPALIRAMIFSAAVTALASTACDQARLPSSDVGIDFRLIGEDVASDIADAGIEVDIDVDADAAIDAVDDTQGDVLDGAVSDAEDDASVDSADDAEIGFVDVDGNDTELDAESDLSIDAQVDTAIDAYIDANSEPENSTAGACSDGLDNDDDGYIDCADEDDCREAVIDGYKVRCFEGCDINISFEPSPRTFDRDTSRVFYFQCKDQPFSFCVTSESRFTIYRAVNPYAYDIEAESSAAVNWEDEALHDLDNGSVCVIPQ